MRIYKLENSIQRYAWGSADGLESCLGIANPSRSPAAELWMGAHPKSPSLAEVGPERKPLDRFIAEDPAGTLGPDALERFGPALPFLFKALSAARPLSIQAHPAKRKAERGFDRENLQGIPLDAPERNYRDANHKPEMTVALTRFEGLCGFRPIDEIVENIELVAPDSHDRLVGRLRKSPGRIELSVFFYSLISLDRESKERMVALATSRIARLLDAGELPEERRAAFAWTLKLKALHPGDIGALAPLILNHLVMEPGEGVFIAPGELHAYLEGTALEIMANSDNVIRGALTEKHIDIPELVSVLSFSPARISPLHPLPGAEGEALYPVGAPDFKLARLGLGGASAFKARPQGPEILLCVEGSCRLESAGASLELGRGESAFVAADAGGYAARGEAVVFRASLPSAAEAPAARSSAES